MGRILAIESDPERTRLLKALVREHVCADLTVVGSVRAGVATFTDDTPDLILAPTLLSPRDSAELTSQVKQLHAAPYIQMLTLPALDMLAEAPADAGRGLSLFRRRRATPSAPKYDAAVVAAQINDGLERARTLREEYESRAAQQPALLPAPEPEQLALTIRAAATAAAAEIAASSRSSQSLALRRVTEERRAARRSAKADVPWLSAVRLSWGLDVKLINISTTGLLLESGSKLTPGITTELHFSGPDTNMLVRARVVRSEVAQVAAAGVRFHAAAAFEKELNALTRERRGATRATASQALASLLADVVAESGLEPEPAHIRFARGVRKLLRARDVLIRRTPIAPVDGSESIYFDVSTDDRSPAILQVMFDRDRDLTAPEFKLLKAAASLTAAVLELEKPLEMTTSAEMEKPMSEVA